MKDYKIIFLVTKKLLTNNQEDLLGFHASGCYYLDADHNGFTSAANKTYIVYAPNGGNFIPALDKNLISYQDITNQEEGVPVDNWKLLTAYRWQQAKMGNYNQMGLI